MQSLLPHADTPPPSSHPATLLYPRPPTHLDLGHVVLHQHQTLLAAAAILQRSSSSCTCHVLRTCGAPQATACRGTALQKNTRRPGSYRSGSEGAPTFSMKAVTSVWPMLRAQCQGLHAPGRQGQCWHTVWQGQNAMSLAALCGISQNLRGRCTGRGGPSPERRMQLSPPRTCRPRCCWRSPWRPGSAAARSCRAHGGGP